MEKWNNLEKIDYIQVIEIGLIYYKDNLKRLEFMMTNKSINLNLANTIMQAHQIELITPKVVLMLMEK